MKSPLKIISISDIHLGNRLVSAESIIKNLNKMLPDTAEMSKIDILFLCGDIFDEALYLPDDHIVGNIQLWIARVLKLCKKWDICLRVLEGTPSHDRKQSKQFAIIKRMLNIDTDFRYVDTLSIEYLERFDCNILYCPDEWRGDNKQTQDEVVELLQQHNLKKVDFAVMHGSFSHQLPEMKHIPVHDAEFYLSIVSKYIFIGHIHIMSQYQRILAQGSFDRLAHNEEQAKGCFYVEAYEGDTKNDQVVFMVNEGAARFNTVNVTDLSKEEVELTLNNAVKDILKNNMDYSIPSFLRIICSKGDPNEYILNSFKKGYNKIRWSVKNDLVKKANTPIRAPAIYVPLPINSNTIVGIISNRLQASGLEDDLIKNTLNILNGLKNV